MAWIRMFGWMVALAVTWCGAGAVTVGWGWLMAPVLRDKRRDLDALFRAFWMGVCLTVAFLQVWHLALPVTAVTVGVWTIVGAVGWMIAGRPALANLAQSARGLHLGGWILLGLVLLFFANRGIGWGIFNSPVWDDGDVNFYHLQAIKWNQSFAIVPGLGNLHSRLAFNNSCFLLQALALHGPWARNGFGIVQGLLALGITLQGWASLRRLGRSDAPQLAAYDILCAALILPVLTMAGPIPGWPLFSTFSDQTEALLALPALPYIWRAVGVWSREADAQDAGVALVLAVALTFTAATAKLNGLLYGVPIFLILAVTWFALFRKSSRDALLSGIAACVLSVMIFGVWALRGIILSGYPLYPSKLFGMAVPWRMPTATVDVEAYAAREWATIMAETPWSAPYWRSIFKPHNLGHFVLPGLVAIAALAWLGLSLVRGRRPALWQGYAVIAGLGLVSAGCWAAVAPQVRFAFAPMWCVAAGSVALAVAATRRPGQGSEHLATTLLVVMASYYALMYAGFLRLGTPGLRGVFNTVVYPPASPAGFYVLPAPNIHQETTASGLVVNVSTGGVKLWDAPLPATPFFDSSLRLRDAADMSKGFERPQ